ncbi:MAG: phospholipid carrier-dependent glycosyltransferase [Chloroflexi bacterium]|nr:phospholipid carrier-dependent glycosyltransferase [Chloroflexota bacterium]MBI3338561.1 phospholipid carrier-dependent glycosyltransferase [Chloroflexota bacterium]
MNRTTIFRLASFLTLSLLSVLGVFLILKATPEGLGLSDDSIAYIAGARSLLAGNGYREAWLASNGPAIHFPPGFSSVLALVGLPGLDPLRGARFVNALLFGLNTALLGILGWRMTKSLPAGLVLAALFVVNDSLLRVHAVAMSEPLFIFLSLLAFWMFDLYFERDNHWLWLVSCGIFVGAAYLTRYAGLALIATFIVALIILHDTWRKRLTGVGIFIASVLPWMAGWALRNQIVGGSVTNRELVWHPITSANFDTALYNISIFLMPVEPWRRVLFKTPFFGLMTALILAATLIWILVKAWKSFVQPLVPHPSPSGRGEVVAFTNGLYVFGYLASIIATMLLFDASTKFKVRILAPVYVSLLILLVVFGLWLWNKRRELVIVLAVFIFGVSAYNQTLTVRELEKGGTAYASFQWYDSQAMEFLRGLPADVKIYTNEPGAVYLYTGRGAYVLPNDFDPVTAEARPGFDQGVAQMQAEINAGRAVLALFAGGENTSTDAITLSKGLYLAYKSSGDEVYTAAP